MNPPSFRGDELLAANHVFGPAANKLSALAQNAFLLAQPESIGLDIRRVPLGYGNKVPASRGDVDAVRITTLLL